MKLAEHRKAIALRKLGYSVKEIAALLLVSKSTASVWVRDVKLDSIAKDRLIRRVGLGRLRSAEVKREKVRLFEEICLQKGRDLVAEITPNNPSYLKLLCAMLYWCEGAKSPRQGVYFTNSDPNLVKKFMELIRQSFEINESKFSPCIHIHGYHNYKKQLDFWSKITNIPKEQFIKPYRKPNTGKRIRDGYQGCIGVRYHSTKVARELIGIAKAFLGGMV